MAADLLNSYIANIESLKLIPSSGGRFEVMAEGVTIYSKKAIGRHAQPGEVIALVNEKLGIEPASPPETDH
ncbi:MAG: Rdx family protein [Anaerolineales bacterium]|nr:Rdx family protein [Anaerolineales bacterium]